MRSAHYGVMLLPVLSVCVNFQLIWLAKELVKSSVGGADSVIHSLMRQIAGKTLSEFRKLLAMIEIYCYFDLG